MRLNIVYWIMSVLKFIWRRKFYLLILGIWVLLIGGIFFLKVYIGPLKPDPHFETFLIGLGISPSIITGMIQVCIGAIYILLWLYMWHRTVQMYFWRTIVKYYPIQNEDSAKQE